MNIDLLFQIAGVGILIFAVNQVLQKAGREDISNVPIFCARSIISLLSMPIAGRKTGISTTASVQPSASIVFDKEEIVRLSRKIGTFELSTLPYEDCCTVFTPRHPRTRPRIDAVEEAEAVLDIEGLVAEAMAGIERVRFDP